MIWQEKIDLCMDKNALRYFEEIKNRVLKLLFHLLDNRGRIPVFLYTSKMAARLALYQIQHDTSRLIGYARKRLHPAAANYSITEL